MRIAKGEYVLQVTIKIEPKQIKGAVLEDFPPGLGKVANSSNHRISPSVASTWRRLFLVILFLCQLSAQYSVLSGVELTPNKALNR